MRRVLLGVGIALAALAPARAHHVGAAHELVGVAIPSILHGEMPVIASYRAEIVALAERQTRTDPVLRRLQGFVSLQYFACLRGLAPRALTDEDSPFNACAHAYLAGARALLAHMADMPGDPSEAKALQARVDADLASAPGMGAICSSSFETFDSATIIWPDWRLAPTHPPTLLTCVSLALLAGAGALGLITRNRRSAEA